MATLSICDICSQRIATKVRGVPVQLPSGQHVIVSVKVEAQEEGQPAHEIDICLADLLAAVAQLKEKR